MRSCRPQGLFPSGLSWTCSSRSATPALDNGSSAGCFGSPGTSGSQIWRAPATSRPYARSSPMTSCSATPACCARRVSIRPSGSSSRKKFCRRSLRDRTATTVSGIATDKMGLSMPNFATAAESGRKSKVRHVPREHPGPCPVQLDDQVSHARPAA